MDFYKNQEEYPNVACLHYKKFKTVTTFKKNRNEKNNNNLNNHMCTKCT